MARELIDLGSFQAVGAGQTATKSLPAGQGSGLVYHALYLEYGTATAGDANQTNVEAEVDEVRLGIDGVTQRVFSAAQLNSILAFNGVGFTTGLVPIYFSEPWRRSAQGEDALRWGMDDVSDFQIDVDIDAAATTPTLNCWALVERLREPLGPIMKWSRFTVAPAATGVFNLHTLPTDRGNYSRLHFFENGAGDINSVEVIREGRKVWDATDEVFEGIYGDNGLTPQAAVTTVAFDYTQRLFDFLPMRVPLDVNGNRSRRVTDFRVNIDYGTAAASTLVAEIFGPRE